MKKVIFSRSTALIGLTASLVMLSSPQKPVQKAAQKALQNNRLSQSAQSLSETDIEPDAQYVFDDSDLALTQSFQDVRYQELSESIQSFLAALDEQQRAAVVRAFDDPFRTRAFCYVLARCNDEFVGLQIQDLNSEQKIALNNLLMKSFSGSGYTRAIQTMNREWLVEETENAHRADPENYPTVGSPLVEEWTPPAKRAAPNYYIAFFGEPASTEPWGLRFEGHHLSFNLTFGGEGEQPTVGIAPMFFGSSPMIIQKAPDVAAGEENPYPQWQQQEGQQLLHREAWLARSFLKSLDTDTLQPGTWSELPDVVLA
ncbi:MAG: DUF3500 domain-containing protein, partial [Cyanobacteria bacterium J06649_4]